MAQNRPNGSKLQHVVTLGNKALHFKDPVALENSGFLCSPAVQDGRDVLQRSEKLAVDRTESAAFTDLAANVEPKTWKMLSLIQFLNNITQLL